MDEWGLGILGGMGVEWVNGWRLGFFGEVGVD